VTAGEPMSPVAPLVPPDSRSADILGDNIEHLRALPEAWVKGKVDFEVPRQLLGGAVDER
jgi:adenine-specific DNA-methyltransferase